MRSGIGQALRVERGETVVDLEHRASQTSPVHRSDHELPVERPEKKEILEYVRRPENAVYPRTGECHADALQILRTVRHRHSVLARPKNPSRRMIGRNQHQAPVSPEARFRPPSLRGSLADRTRSLGPNGG